MTASAVEPHFNEVALPLGLVRKGFHGMVDRIAVGADSGGVSADEVERRLLELGFFEGADVRVLHEGLIGRDPIAVRVDGATVALRRREAMWIWVVDCRDRGCCA